VTMQWKIFVFLSEKKGKGREGRECVTGLLCVCVSVCVCCVFVCVCVSVFVCVRGVVVWLRVCW